MRVLVIMPLGEQRGGAELALLHLMQEGRDLGVEWIVLFLEDGPMVAQISALGIRTEQVTAGHLRQVHQFALSVGRIAWFARSHRVQAILSWMGKPHFYGAPAALLAGVPSLWFQMGLPTSRSRMDRMIARLPARGIVACSEFVARAQAHLSPGRPIRAVHLAAELDRFDAARLPTPTAMRARLKLPSGPLIGIVGRMQRWKGMHTLVEAMPAVLTRFPEAHAVIVGGDHALEEDYSDYLRGRIQALKIADRVILAGLQRNVPEWMQAFDVIVHASDREPFGIVIVEAMALGKPVIAGAEGGPTEILSDGIDGLLCPFEDSERLATAILRYLEDPAFAERMAQAACRRAQEFSTRRYAERVTQAVQELLT